MDLPSYISQKTMEVLMADLSTKYLGMTLKNPIIAGSSGITQTLKGIQECEKAGAGAVVLKSLFEEQIETLYKDTSGQMSPPWHPEIYDYIERLNKEFGPRDYLSLIKAAKKSVTIPVIASIHCFSVQSWTDFAQKIEESGADGIELNMYIFSSDKNTTAERVENTYLEILRKVKAKITIPVSIKLSPYFTNLTHFAAELNRQGAAGLVFFNRFQPLDIDINNLKPVSGAQFSSPEEKYTSLRWIALLAGELNCDLAASTGLHSSADVIKQLLAGASAVELSSILYQKGIGYISTILDEITAWMQEHNFSSVDQFKGSLSQKSSPHPELYERFQFIQASIRYISE